MNVLITGANGMLGTALVNNFKNLRDGKNKTRPNLRIDDIYTLTRENTEAELESACFKADYVFHLAGVNRPKDEEEFMRGNYEFTAHLLDALKKAGGKATVMFSSSVQAGLSGRFEGSEYGRSKLAGENSVFAYAEETGTKAMIYRFPNLLGHSRPNYNSAVSTFCYNIARDYPIVINDPLVELEMLFVEDLLEEMYDLLEGHPHRAEYPKAGESIDGVTYDGLTPRPCTLGRYCYAPLTYKATLGRIVELLHMYHDQPQTLLMPSIPDGSFEKKLFSLYLSYLPREKIVYDLKMNCDERGSFTELMKTADHGQFSINISKPGITKGQHWHNSKWELFIVISGHGLIQERALDSDTILEFEVSSDRLQAIHMLPGFTHNIINLSDTEELVTIMWANEVFDSDHPDTFSEKV